MSREPTPAAERRHPITCLLVSDWTWRLFDEGLDGREIDFPVLGWRRIWIEELRPNLTVEVREWHFGVDHPDSALLPAPAWHRAAHVASKDQPSEIDRPDETESA